MGPIGDRQDPGGAIVGPMNFVICEWTDQDTIIPCVAAIPLKAVLYLDSMWIEEVPRD